MKQEDSLLFCQSNISEVLRNIEAKMYLEIDELKADYLLKADTDELVQYFVENYKLDVPVLQDTLIETEQSETEIDDRDNPRRHIINRGKSFIEKATLIRFYLPFIGNSSVFYYRPSQCNYNPPRASVVGDELLFNFIILKDEGTQVKSLFDSQVNAISQYLNLAKTEIGPFNSAIHIKALHRINLRRDKLSKDEAIVNSMGYPLRNRPGAPKTYSVPLKKINLALPLSKKDAPLPREPELEMAHYNQILSIISNMVAVMEYSPKAFKGMEEENLRQHFLVQLNAQYEGQATGETFNFEGKTDILVRVKGKNVFIAECKFWHGPDSLSKAIDQILNYSSWRDTKTAILIFNRTKQLSSVLPAILKVVKDHPNYLRQLPYGCETGYRFAIHHRDDKEREIILSVIAFEVPS